MTASASPSSRPPSDGQGSACSGAPAQEYGDGGRDEEGLLAEQLLRLTRRVQRIQRRHVAESGTGVTPAQARLLRILIHREEPPRMADLAEALEVVPRAITGLVDGLEERSMVRRSPDPTSRRAVRIELTEEGRHVLHELRRSRRAAAEEILAPLDSAQRTALENVLDALFTSGPGSGAGPAAGSGHGSPGGLRPPDAPGHP